MHLYCVPRARTSIRRVDESCSDMTPIPSLRAPAPWRTSEPRAAIAARVVLRTVRRGAETIAWTPRPARIDVDVFAVAASAAPPLAAEANTEPFVIELAVPADAPLPAVEFTPTLRSIDGPVGRAIVALAERCERGRRAVPTGDVAAELWSGLVAEEEALRARAARIECARPATRVALFRRLLLSADYIQGHFAEPLKVEQLASVSNLSPFHFARLFALVMDETPHAFLVRKRVAVARRLLASGVGRGEAAERSGFGSRSTLFRHLRQAAAPH